ncbi:MAG: fructose-2,6-bisphosphatase, partial [Rhodospirillales bacterium]|nr:fructose-2,6-bisphosphatase [Rhodospirillales bacterium]
EELIYLVRHGQTEFNHAQRLQGQRDSTLTELGVQQARRMGNHLKPLVDDHERWIIIASPLGRTVRTAEIIRETIGLKSEITLDPRIQEVHVGDWEGYHHHEIEAAAPGAMKEPGWLLRAPGGEGYEDIAGRIGSFIAEINETDGHRRILVSHGIAGRILRALYCGVPPDQIWAGKPPPQDAVFHLSGGKIVRIDERDAA